MLDRRFFLEGCDCHCSIGFYAHERAAPQPVVIDAELVLDTGTEPINDDVDTTLDYDRIRDTIKAIAQSQHFDLQETLARKLFDALHELPGVTAVRVKTAKPDAYDDCRQIAYQLSDLGQIS